MTEKYHYFHLRIYYEDTDAGGVIYHANYIKFAERARTDIMHQQGITNRDLTDKFNIFIVVRHIDVNYTAPGKLEDQLTVKSRVVEFGHTSFLMEQIVMRDDLTLATLMVKLVCVDANTMRPVRVPEKLKGILG